MNKKCYKAHVKIKGLYFARSWGMPGSESGSMFSIEQFKKSISPSLIAGVSFSVSCGVQKWKVCCLFPLSNASYYHQLCLCTCRMRLTAGVKINQFPLWRMEKNQLTNEVRIPPFASFCSSLLLLYKYFSCDPIVRGILCYHFALLKPVSFAVINCFNYGFLSSPSLILRHCWHFYCPNLDSQAHLTWEGRYSGFSFNLLVTLGPLSDSCVKKLHLSSFSTEETAVLT